MRERRLSAFVLSAMLPTTILRDPVHGDIELTSEEIGLIDTAEFQRLRGIKQLGTASLVYPGAVHTRFEHSIGVLHMTDRLLDAVNKNAARSPASCIPVDESARRILRMAALVHDVTHIPFGHNIEDQTGLLPRHDSAERYHRVLGDTELGAALERLGVRDQVMGVLGAGGEEVPPFWRQVLSDTIDPDLMDYLRRDAYYTGLELRYDQRVVDYFRVDREHEQLFVDCEKQGMLREDIMSELMRMLETRFHFSERVYYHHAKVAAGALVSRMVEIGLRAGVMTADDLQQATDESLLQHLQSIDVGDAALQAKLARYLQRYRRRALPKRVAVFPLYVNEAIQDEVLNTWFGRGTSDARFDWEADREAEVASRSDAADPVDVLLYCPSRKMQLKEAKTLVRMPGSGSRTVPLDSFSDQLPRLADLQQAYPRLWKLYVFTSARDVETRRTLQDLCLKALPAQAVNALRLGA